MEGEKAGVAVGPTKKRPSQVSDTSDLTFKKPKTPETFSGDEDEDESVLELRRLLEAYADMVPNKVQFAPFPYAWHRIYDSCSSYITINVGHEESCGSSFSDSESSVMASVDLGSLLDLSSVNISSPEFGFAPVSGDAEKNSNAWDWANFDEALDIFTREGDN